MQLLTGAVEEANAAPSHLTDESPALLMNALRVALEVRLEGKLTPAGPAGVVTHFLVHGAHVLRDVARVGEGCAAAGEGARVAALFIVDGVRVVRGDGARDEGLGARGVWAGVDEASVGAADVACSGGTVDESPAARAVGARPGRCRRRLCHRKETARWGVERPGSVSAAGRQLAMEIYGTLIFKSIQIYHWPRFFVGHVCNSGLTKRSASKELSHTV